MFMSNIIVSFQFIQITFIYFSYLFSIRSPVASCLQIDAQDTYDLWFGCSLYAWKEKEIIFPMQPVSWLIKSESPAILETKSFSSTHRNAIFPFHKMLSLAPTCTHKHEIIQFHNILMTNLSIMCTYLPCVCVISFFYSNFSKSHLFTSHICFQFRVQDHLAFKLTHKTHATSDLDVISMHGKIRR
jgi:hypothetical protein